MSLNADPRSLRPFGWLLIVLAVGAIATVAIPIGTWILRTGPPGFIRENRGWLIPVLALPCLLAGVVVFSCASRIARRLGFAVLRDDPNG